MVFAGREEKGDDYVPEAGRHAWAVSMTMRLEAAIRHFCQSISKGRKWIPTEFAKGETADNVEEAADGNAADEEATGAKQERKEKATGAKRKRGEKKGANKKVRNKGAHKKALGHIRKMPPCVEEPKQKRPRQERQKAKSAAEDVKLPSLYLDEVTLAELDGQMPEGFDACQPPRSSSCLAAASYVQPEMPRPRRSHVQNPAATFARLRSSFRLVPTVGPAVPRVETIVPPGSRKRILRFSKCHFLVEWMPSMDGTHEWSQWMASMDGIRGLQPWMASMGGIRGCHRIRFFMK